MAFSFGSAPSAQTVTQRVARMSSDAEARRLVSSHNLSIVNVSWDDCARNKMSCWGPCISDMTLQTGSTRMPVIREPNFTDKTWDVPIDKIPLLVGNEKPEGTPVRTIPLSEYLRNFSHHISKPPTDVFGNINLLVESGAKPDRHVVMSSQACFLPVEEGDQTKFNVALYNYQSKPDNPAVLVIVSTSKGTSAQIVTGGDQKLLFNNHGIKADFAGQRLRDNRRERGVALDGEMSREEKQDNVIVVIQVPLVHREQPRYDSFGSWGGGFGGGSYGGYGSGFGNSGSSSGFGMASGGFAMPGAPCAQSGGFGAPAQFQAQGHAESFSRKRSVPRPDVVAAIVRVAPRTEVTCSCGGVLTKRKSWSCYEGQAVNCDGCRASIRGDNWVYHCGKGKFFQHRSGYDLCENCGNKQLEFDECGGRSIQRDVRYPIRVTLQYYKATANGVMNAGIMNEIALQLAASRHQAEAVGSLVTEVTNRTTEPVLNQSRPFVVNSGYAEVEAMLRRLHMQEYLPNFREQQINDETLLLLEPHHVSSLITKIGPRARFESELVRWKKEKNGGAGDWMNGFF